jgi:acyl dehydratase
MTQRDLVSGPVVTADALEVGRTYDLGSYAVSESAIIAFASEWDPQPFHCDVEAARDGYFGAIIASGVHTFAVYQRLAGALYASWAVIAGRRITDIELPRPVYGGSVLHGEVTIAAIRDDKPGRALVVSDGRLTVEGDTVYSLRTEMYVRRTAP